MKRAVTRGTRFWDEPNARWITTDAISTPGIWYCIVEEFTEDLDIITSRAFFPENELIKMVRCDV